ncbi:hypothetical protein MAPG_06861 [Magnaporthiopsis poae ATCC 64411]|uniref:Uncharacterized protein n=1 Tax=Magnaporthiopsis poae (strain ATCC 64411 / 73-15) TaxID=644358 RepID=A0A0C4E368_MAGP6|nr:hypothetical protein MAPG_06861 [Magnaporthiopsis poae ATCC 64411]
MTKVRGDQKINATDVARMFSRCILLQEGVPIAKSIVCPTTAVPITSRAVSARVGGYDIIPIYGPCACQNKMERRETTCRLSNVGLRRSEQEGLRREWIREGPLWICRRRGLIERTLGNRAATCCKMSSFCFGRSLQYVVADTPANEPWKANTTYHQPPIAPHHGRPRRPRSCLFFSILLSAGGRSSGTCASVASVRRRRLHIAEPCSTAYRDTCLSSVEIGGVMGVVGSRHGPCHPCIYTMGLSRWKVALKKPCSAAAKLERWA